MKQHNIDPKHGLTAILFTLLVTACGGGGGDGGGTVNEAPVAVAGDDFLVSSHFNVSLDGSASSDVDGDPLTYTWTQTAGPDVTAGAGFLTGEAPDFQAPAEVSTLIFELVVNDGQEGSVADTMSINVLENVAAAYFVDGDTGSDDTGNGSVENPFVSIGGALCAVTQEQQDIYVKTRANNAVYDETVDPCPGEPARNIDQILVIQTGTSLYGGYDENGIRDAINNPVLVTTSHHGFVFTAVNFDAWFSGFNVRSNDSPGPENSVYALSVLGGDASMFIHDNQLISGDVAFGSAATPGASYGLRVALLQTASIERNIISAGFGGDGLDTGNIFNTAAERGQDGFNAGGRTGGSGGEGKGGEDYDGGGGGNAGSWSLFCASHDGANGSKGQGTEGGAGGIGGKSCGAGGNPGGLGGTGNDGAIGLGGNGSGTMEVNEEGGFFASFLPGKGNNGNTGEAGHGGGGGGGAGNALYNGGGGGGGGAGGAGGPGGSDGGVSVGLFIAAVNSSLIDNNDISSGREWR